MIQKWNSFTARDAEAEEFLALVLHNTNKKNIILSANFPAIKTKNVGRCLSGGYSGTELLGAQRERVVWKV